MYIIIYIYIYTHMRYGSLSAALQAADSDSDERMSYEELWAQAQPLCVSETEALRFHRLLDVQQEGIVDLAALSAGRMPFYIRRDASLAGYRMCLQSYFDSVTGEIVQDIENTNDGFPATIWGLVKQAADIAWELPDVMAQVFSAADLSGTGLLSRARYRQIFAGNATLAGLRVHLLQVPLLLLLLLSLLLLLLLLLYTTTITTIVTITIITTITNTIAIAPAPGGPRRHLRAPRARGLGQQRRAGARGERLV